MKKCLFLMLAVATAVMGCRKELLPSDDLPKGGGISFSTYLGGVSKGVSRDRFVAGYVFEVVGYNAGTPFKNGVTGAITMPATARLLFDERGCNLDSSVFREFVV